MEDRRVQGRQEETDGLIPPRRHLKDGRRAASAAGTSGSARAALTGAVEREGA